MNRSLDIQILAPMPKTKLGRFRGRTGVFIMREGDLVLYIGWANDIYGTCCRYFSKNGPLEMYEIKQANFEVILCRENKTKKITRILKDYLQPLKNTLYFPQKLNSRERQQKQRLLNLYRQGSFFKEDFGDHKTDQ